MSLVDALGHEHHPHGGVSRIVSLVPTRLSLSPKWFFRCIVNFGHSGKMPSPEDW